MNVCRITTLLVCASAIGATGTSSAFAASPSDAMQAFKVPATVAVNASGVARVPTVLTWTPGTSPVGNSCCTSDVYKPNGDEVTTNATTLPGAPWVLDPTSDTDSNCGFEVDSYDSKGVYVGSVFSEAPTFCLYLGAIQENDRGNPPSYSGGWHEQRISSAWGGGVKYSTASGASVTFNCFGCRSIEWVTTTGPSHGAARVYIDGALTATVSTHASATHYRHAVFHYELPSLDSFSTIRIVNAGTAGHSRVDLDAFVASSED